MWYLLNAYWIALLLAGLLGLIVGWMSCDRHSTRSGSHGGWFSGWIPWAVAATALAALAAINAALPGKQGLLLETALMLFGAYMLGCCIGCILKPKPAAHLAHATAGGTTSGKAAAAAAAGLAAATTASGQTAGKGSGTTGSSTGTSTGKTGASTTATSSTSGAAAAKPASGLTSSVGSGTKPGTVSGSTSTSATTGTSTSTGSTGKVVTALGAAAAGVAATAAAGKGTASAAAPTGADANIKVFTGVAKFGERPVLYNAARGGKGDELSLIWGVAEKLEHKMNAAGIWHFDQIANWTEANVEWFEHEFEGFKGRLDRDKWIEQCKRLAAGWRPDGHVGQRAKG